MTHKLVPRAFDWVLGSTSLYDITLPTSLFLASVCLSLSLYCPVAGRWDFCTQYQLYYFVLSRSALQRGTRPNEDPSRDPTKSREICRKEKLQNVKKIRL